MMFIILSGILWGAMGIFVRGLAESNLTTFEINGIRIVISVFIMAAFIFLYDRKLFKIKLNDVWCFLGTGVLSLSFLGICYFTSIQLSSLSVAAVLLYTSPVWIMIFSAFLFREKITALKLFCIFLSIAGCAFVSGIVDPGFHVPVKGLFFGLGAGISYALYSIFGRYALKKKYNPLTITFYSFFFSAFVFLILIDPSETIQKIKNGAALKNSFYALGISLFTTVLPYVFYTIGLSKMENSKAGILACSEPIAAAVFGFIIFSEMPKLTEFLGIVLVLGSIVLMNVFSGRHKSSDS